MKLPHMSAKTVLLLAIPLLALLVIGVPLILRQHDAGSIERERRELEEMLNAQKVSSSRDPAALVAELRLTQQGALATGSGPNMNPGTAKSELLRLGAKAIPPLKKAIYDRSEAPLFRMELIAVLGEVKDAEAEALLIEILLDGQLEEQFRTLALVKSTGRRSEAVFNAHRKMYSEEKDLGVRHLVIRAIAESGRPEATPLLLEASKRESNVSARIQAVDALGERVRYPGVLDAVREVLLTDSNENVRLAAITALGKCPDPSVDRLLEDIARNPEMAAPLRKAAENWSRQRQRK